MTSLRSLTVVALALLVAAPLAAQVPPPMGPPPGAGAAQQPGAPPPDVALKAILGLSDTQMAQVQALEETRRTAMEALQRQIGDAQKALGTALQATPPDPATVGAALLKVDSLQKQVKPIADAFRTGFEALLTSAQRSQLDAIRHVDAALHAADALRPLGIL